MIEIRGAHNTAICYCRALDETAEAQIRAVCDREEFAGCKMRIMPDVNAGMGYTIGTTMTVRDKIVPGMVAWTSAAAWRRRASRNERWISANSTP
jgi:hypothetical protein